MPVKNVQKRQLCDYTQNEVLYLHPVHACRVLVLLINLAQHKSIVIIVAKCKKTILYVQPRVTARLKSILHGHTAVRCTRKPLNDSNKSFASCQISNKPVNSLSKNIAVKRRHIPRDLHFSGVNDSAIPLEVS